MPFPCSSSLRNVTLDPILELPAVAIHPMLMESASREGGGSVLILQHCRQEAKEGCQPSLECPGGGQSPSGGFPSRRHLLPHG